MEFIFKAESWEIKQETDRMMVEKIREIIMPDVVSRLKEIGAEEVAKIVNAAIINILRRTIDGDDSCALCGKIATLLDDALKNISKNIKDEELKTLLIDRLLSK